MRLVCPNCDAEYEVDNAVIPDGGRDVQCSNCGHAWFQISPELEAEIASEEALYEAPPAAEPPPEVEPVKPMASSIDDSVLAVLREEAEREVEARRAEAPRLETQTDMALEAPEASGLGAVARRLARLKGIETEKPAKPPTRADAFPEIDEINSTLRASSEKRSGAAAVSDQTTAKPASASFRSGFALMLVAAALVVTVYVMAPKLSQQFPAAEGALTSFVAGVDALRIALDQKLQAAIAVLRGLAGNS